jgi:chromosome segregation ATPase
MARRDLNVDEEKRSYAGLWLLCAGLLVVGAVWAIMDDTFLRRPWKAYQRSYFQLEEKTAYDALEQEKQKLASNPEYVDLDKQLAEANRELTSGESAKKLADADGRLQAASVREHDADLRVRFVKSELEEAWYEYDHAIESGGDVNAARARRDKLSADKERLDADWKATQHEMETIQAEIAEIRSPAKTIETKMKDLAAERERIETKIAGLKSNVSQF